MLRTWSWNHWYPGEYVVGSCIEIENWNSDLGKSILLVQMEALIGLLAAVVVAFEKYWHSIKMRWWEFPANYISHVIIIHLRRNRQVLDGAVLKVQGILTIWRSHDVILNIAAEKSRSFLEIHRGLIERVLRRERIGWTPACMMLWLKINEVRWIPFPYLLT